MFTFLFLINVYIFFLSVNVCDLFVSNNDQTLTFRSLLLTLYT